MEKRIQEVTTGCIYISGAVEYDDRADEPGARTSWCTSVTMWRAALMRAISTRPRKKGTCARTTDPRTDAVRTVQLHAGPASRRPFPALCRNAVRLPWAALKKLISLTVSERKPLAKVRRSGTASRRSTAALHV